MCLYLARSFSETYFTDFTKTTYLIRSSEWDRSQPFNHHHINGPPPQRPFPLPNDQKTTNPSIQRWNFSSQSETKHVSSSPFLPSAQATESTESTEPPKPQEPWESKQPREPREPKEPSKPTPSHHQTHPFHHPLQHHPQTAPNRTEKETTSQVRQTAAQEEREKRLH